MESLVVGDIAELRPNQVGPSCFYSIGISHEPTNESVLWLGGTLMDQTQLCSLGTWSP